MSSVSYYSLYGNDAVTMQLESDTQPVNGSDSLETVQLPLSKGYNEYTNDSV